MHTNDWKGSEDCSLIEFSWAQRLKRLTPMQETWVQSLGQEDPLEKKTGNPLQYFCLENLTDRGAW